jgi:DNA-directed RNA polymerase subunit M/transcription elongation factor TFIIS
MHFCSVCSNMYYISVTPENELQYYCRNCGNIDQTIASENICVSKVNVKQTTSTTTFSQVVNKYTKYDPTLPRIHTMRCPNDECPSHASSSLSSSSSTAKHKSEIIYVRYDDTNLKFVYLCTKCDKIWNTESTYLPHYRLCKIF